MQTINHPFRNSLTNFAPIQKHNRISIPLRRSHQFQIEDDQDFQNTQFQFKPILQKKRLSPNSLAILKSSQQALRKFQSFQETLRN